MIDPLSARVAVCVSARVAVLVSSCVNVINMMVLILIILS